MAPVVVNLDVTVDSSGNISVFGQSVVSMTNVIVADYMLPIRNLYLTTDNSLIKFQQTSNDPNTIYATRDTAFNIAQSSLEENLKTILENSFDCQFASPFNSSSSDYYTQESFGHVALASYAYSLFGHVAATAAIDNDVELVVYLNSDTASDAAINKALASAIYGLVAEKATAIARQVIGQDSSRAHFEDNNTNWQALEFKNNDVIYVSVALKAPIVTVSNNAQQTIPDAAIHGTNTYAIKITMTDQIVPTAGAIENAINAGTTFTYPSTTLSLFTYAATSNSPILSGGVLSSYSISPALPTGLSIDSTTGVISGTPTTVTSPAYYTITATRTDSTTTTRTVSISTSSQAPSSFSYAASPYSLEAGSAITPITPTIPGTFSLGSYSISPALPTGLSINSSTGAISGTATAITSATTYTVTASRTVDSVVSTTTLSIATPSPPPTAFSYAATPYSFDAGNEMTPITPTIVGGFTLASYSVSPALPTGMSINSSTGAISGTPTAITSATSYTVTAVRTFDTVSSTTTLSITTVNVPTTGLNFITADRTVYVSNTDSTTKLIYLGPNENSVQLYSSALPANATDKTIQWLWFNNPANPAITLSSSGLITIPEGAAFVQLEPFARASNGNIRRVYISRRSPSSNVSVETAGTIGYGTSSLPTSGFTYYNSTIVTTTGTYTAGTSITTANGGLLASTDLINASYSISPSLPVGMFVDSFTGFIGGTPPTTSRSTSTYTVTASVSGQTRTKVITVTVNPKAATTAPVLGFFYSGALPSAPRTSVPYTLFMGNQGGAVTSAFSVSPALPTGLALNTTTGDITGTPTGTAALTTYTVSGNNSFGSTSATISFAVTA